MRTQRVRCNASRHCYNLFADLHHLYPTMNRGEVTVSVLLYKAGVLIYQSLVFKQPQYLNNENHQTFLSIKNYGWYRHRRIQTTCS